MSDQALNIAFNKMAVRADTGVIFLEFWSLMNTSRRC